MLRCPRSNVIKLHKNTAVAFLSVLKGSGDWIQFSFDQIHVSQSQGELLPRTVLLFPAFVFILRFVKALIEIVIAFFLHQAFMDDFVSEYLTT